MVSVMMKFLRCLTLLAGLFASSASFAQQINPGDVIGNGTVAKRSPTDSTIASVLKQGLCGTNDSVPYYTSSWACLGLLGTAHSWTALQTFSGGATVTTSFTATGLVTNADLVNAGTTVNGVNCVLGSTCSIVATASSITIGTTTIVSGSNTKVLFDNSAVIGEYSVTGSGNVVMSASPTLSGTVGGGITLSGNNTYSGTSNFTGATTVTSTSFGLAGNISSPAWTTSGIRYKNVSAILTDTSSSGTVATAYTDVWGGNTIAASSATVFTNYFGSYFIAPSPGSNVTLTNAWGIGATSANIGTTNPVTITSTGVVTVPGTLNASGTFQIGGTSVNLSTSTTQYAAVKIDNSTITVNGSGQLQASGSVASAIAVGTTSITSGSGGNIEFNNAGTLGEVTPGNGISISGSTLGLTAARRTNPTTSYVTGTSHSGGFGANGSGTYTTPSNVIWVKFRMKGAGAGGAGSGGGSGGGVAGGNTCLNTSGAACTSPVYSSGAGNGGGANTGGIGGIVTGSSTCDIPRQGFSGGASATAISGSTNVGGGMGGGEGGGNSGSGGGANAQLNSGGGGGGAGIGATTTANSGGGGGSGAECDTTISGPAGTYTYAVGAGGNGGSAGASGAAGGNGAGGWIEAEEHYGS
jgi:hypothetical protein